MEPWIDELQRYEEAGGSLEDLGKRFRDAGIAVESAIVVPVDVAVGVEVFANNCARNIWTAIDCEIGRRGVKYSGEANG